MIAGHPALRYLARAKLVGMLRKQRRRLRTPSGCVLALLGLGLLAMWLASLLWPAFRQGTASQPASRGFFEVGCALLTLLSVSTALGHRGLYVPQTEIERLFAAPISREDLARYRLLASLGRSILGSLVLGVLAMRHAPVPAFGLVGAWVAAMTLPIVSQGVSLFAGDAENRLMARLARLPRGAVTWTATILLALGAMALFMRGQRAGRKLEGFLESLGAANPSEWLEHPIARVILAPFQPWSRMMTANTAPSFAVWLAVCVLIWIFGFELVARIQVDYRELSLSTAADVAKRMQRLRRGKLDAGSSSAPRASAGWRVPWLFGRGPFGAIAWRKLASIVRKSRTTILTGVLVIAAVTFMTIVAFRQSDESAIAGTSILIGVGSIYLCGALRFDFREDLDAMTLIKSWPLAPWRIFAATLAPQALLVSLLIAAGIVARVLITRHVPPLFPLWLMVIPVVVITWLAIDNAAFLYAPVRLTPGQDGILQNAGRAIVLMLARMAALVVFALVTITAGLPAIGLGVLLAYLDVEPRAVVVAVSIPALFAVGCAFAVLVWIGGLFLRRFDVARDRA